MIERESVTACVCAHLFVSVVWPLTHAVLHHHEATLISLEALALKVSRCVHTRALATQVRRDATLVDVCKGTREQRKCVLTLFYLSGSTIVYPSNFKPNPK